MITNLQLEYNISSFKHTPIPFTGWWDTSQAKKILIAIFC